MLGRLVDDGYVHRDRGVRPIYSLTQRFVVLAARALRQQAAAHVEEHDSSARVEPGSGCLVFAIELPPERAADRVSPR
jgi:hypothetical protein